MLGIEVIGIFEMTGLIEKLKILAFDNHFFNPISKFKTAGHAADDWKLRES